jgi:hypothetical protein
MAETVWNSEADEENARAAGKALTAVAERLRH